VPPPSFLVTANPDNASALIRTACPDIFSGTVRTFRPYEINPDGQHPPLGGVRPASGPVCRRIRLGWNREHPRFANWSSQ
jgi:hypothetical protein